MEADPHSVTLEQLLAEVDWIRSLARALVRDVNEADDLAQDTLLAALRRPPHGDRPLRPWLGSVLRNFARERTRTGARREAREQTRADEREFLPSSSELAERVELQQLVVRLVLDLPQPLRTTVLLCYFEGLSPTEIAERTGEPAGTVRWRLKRGLDLVRERLDERHGGDRDAWRLALLPLLREPVKLASAMSGSAITLSGALAMLFVHKWIVVSLVAVACLGGLWWSGWLPGSPDETRAVAAQPPSEPSATAANDEVEPEVLVVTPPERSEVTIPDAQAPAPVASRTARVRVRFVDAAKHGIAGVELVGEVGGYTQTATSGASGLVELASDLLPSLLTARLRAVGPAFSRWSDSVAIGPGEEVDLGDVELSPGGAVSGRVIDRNGRGVFGVVVRVSDAKLPADEREAQEFGAQFLETWSESRSGIDGTFHAVGLPLGACRVWARTDDIGWSWSDEIEIEPAREHGDVVVTLREPRKEPHLRVRVLDPDGKPVTNLSVRYRRDANTQWSFHFGTFNDGLIDLSTGIPRVERVAELIASERTGQFGEGHVTDLEARDDEFVLHLAPAHEVELHAVDERGEPVEQFHVFVYDERFESEAFNAAQTRAGVAAVSLLEGRCHIDVVAPGFARGRVESFDPRGLTGPLQVVLQRQPGLTGRVVDEAGQPVAHAEVALHALNEGTSIQRINGAPSRVAASAEATTKTDAQGSFRIDLVKRGRYLVAFSAQGFAADRSEELDLDPALGRSSLELVLTRGGRIEGRLVAGEGARVARAQVLLARGDTAIQSTRCDVDGRFEFEAVAPGAWRVWRTLQQPTPFVKQTVEGIEVPTGWQFPTNCVVRAGETTHVELAMAARAALAVEGSLTIAGQPAHKWPAWLFPVQAEDPFDELDRIDGRVGADGRYHLLAQGSGHYLLGFSEPGDSGEGLYFRRDCVLVGAGRECSLDLELGSLEGSLATASEATLFCAWRGPTNWRAKARVTVDSRRHFALARVPAGTVRLVRLEPGQWNTDEWEWPLVAEFEVRAGETAHVDVR